MEQLCIDLGGSAAKVGIVRAGEVLASRTVPVDRNFAIEDLEPSIRLLLAERETPSAPSSIGIAVPGIVDVSGGRLISAHDKYPRLIGTSLTDWASDRFQVPAFIENDARAALLGESAYGVAQGVQDSAIMVLGTGIGTAAMMSGRLVRGSRDHAGVLGGHLTVSLDGSRCQCGNVGCAESLASTWALQSAVRDDLESPAYPDFQPHDIAALVEAYRGGNSVAERVLGRFISVWGATLVSLCHAYDPSLVIVSGGVMSSHDVLLPRLTEYLHEHLWSSSFRPPVVVPDKPQLSVMRGLAALPQSSASERSEL